MTVVINTSVIKQKGEYQNRGDKKTKHPEFSEKQTFLPPCIRTCISGGGEISVFERFGVLFFLVTSVLRFALFPYYRRIDLIQSCAHVTTRNQKTVVGSDFQSCPILLQETNSNRDFLKSYFFRPTF